MGLAQKWYARQLNLPFKSQNLAIRWYCLIAITFHFRGVTTGHKFKSGQSLEHHLTAQCESVLKRRPLALTRPGVMTYSNL